MLQIGHCALDAPYALLSGTHDNSGSFDNVALQTTPCSMPLKTDLLCFVYVTFFIEMPAKSLP